MVNDVMASKVGVWEMWTLPKGGLRLVFVGEDDV